MFGLFTNDQSRYTLDLYLMLKNKTKICHNATFHAISKSLHYIKVLRLSNRCRGLTRLLASSFKNSKYIRSKGDDSNVELEPICNTKKFL